MTAETTTTATEQSAAITGWPASGGAMAERIRVHDWATTPLGPMAEWPRSLKTAVDIALDSVFPTFVWWGPELIELHNDAARAIRSAKASGALGMPAREVWSDVWPDVGPLFARVLETGEPFTTEDLPLVLDRGGLPEDASFTFCYSVLRDQNGGIAGIQAVAIETTERVRSQQALHDSEARLAADLAGMRRLYDLHARLANETDLHMALGEIVAAANTFLDTERGCIQLVSDDGERLEMFAFRGYHEQDRFIQHFLHEGSKPACDAARRTQQRLVIEDVATFPDLLGTTDREVALADGIRATQSTPMIGRSGELVGVLSNQFPQPHRPSDDALRLIDLLAWTAADFVERHKAHEALREREARQGFVLELSDALRPLSDPVAIEATVTRAVGAHLGASRACFVTITPDQTTAVVQRDYASGVPSMAGSYPLVDYPFSVEELRAGKPLVVSDVRRDNGYGADEMPRMVALALTAVVSIPIVKQGAWVGALTVGHAAPHAWSPEEVALLAELAERTWAAVERARAEAALRESEAKYRTLFESIDEGFNTIEVIFDNSRTPIDVRLLAVNPAYETMTGLGRDVVGRRLREVMPTVEDRVIEQYGRVALTGEPVRFEEYVRVLDRWFDVYASRAGGDGSATVNIVFTNITERKRREANLVFLADVSEDLVRLTDMDATMDALGEKIGEQFGVSLCAFSVIDEAAGTMTTAHAWSRAGIPNTMGMHRISDYHSEAFRRACRAGETYVARDTANDARADAAAMAAIQVGAYVSVPLARDGAWRFNLTIADTAPRDWRDDEIELLRELATRIWTRLERARAEEALRESAARYRTLFRSLNIGFCTIRVIFDAAQKPVDYVFLQVNPAFEVQTGLVDAVGKRVREMVPGHEEHWFEIYGRIALTGNPEQFENQAAALGRWYRVDAFRIGPPEHCEVGVLFEDISERRQAEAERRAFIDAAAHDLRTPLTSLKGRAQLLEHRARRGRLTDAAALTAGLDAITADANRMAALIAEMLDAAHLETGQLLELDRFPVDLAALVENAAEETRRNTTRHAIRVVAAAPAPVGQWDESRLRRVLTNLLDNAVKYSPDGGEVVVRVDREENAAGAWATVAVSDQGVGIPATDLPRLFERFRRGRNTARFRGTGIGLSGARQIVEQHGGEIEIASVEGQGSTFTVRLPLTGE